MKKYLIVVIIILILLATFFITYYVSDFYIIKNSEIVTFTASDTENIYVNGDKYIIKGVNLGAGIPGHFATEYAIDKKTYKRWFKQIQEMGANTIRVYTILSPEFYNAFYEYNKNNEKPLYLLHGVWVDDYIQNSKIDAYSDLFMEKLLDDSKIMTDVIHGRKYIAPNNDFSSGLYTRDISKWVIGYILGVEWEDVTVAYTDYNRKVEPYIGKYLSVKENASTFTNVLAYVGDQVIEYETEKYGQQRLIAFSNWPTTDPFKYDKKITDYFKKCAEVDVEKLSTKLFTDKYTLEDIIKELKNPEMVRYIRESRLALVKKIAELEAKLPEIKKLEARVEEKTNSYAKKENTSEEIAGIMLKVVDKRYRADSLKLSEFEKELFDAKHTLQVLDRMEREVTGLLIPENMLEKYVNGKGII